MKCRREKEAKADEYRRTWTIYRRQINETKRGKDKWKMKETVEELEATSEHDLMYVQGSKNDNIESKVKMSSN